MLKPPSCNGCALESNGGAFMSAAPRDNPLLLVQTETPLTGDYMHWLTRNILHPAGLEFDQVLLDSVLRCISYRAYPTGKNRKEAEVHCRRYDQWRHHPEVSLLLMGPKAIAQHYPSESVQEMHGHIEPIDGRVVGCTYPVPSVLGNPNLLPLVVREVYNLMRAAKRPELLARPKVTKGWLLARTEPFAFDLEWNAIGAVTVVGVAYESSIAYSAFNASGEKEEEVRMLIAESSLVSGHNIITADLPTLGYSPVEIRDLAPRLLDTMIAAHLVHPHFASESRDEGGMGLGLLDLQTLVKFYDPTMNWKFEKGDLLQYNGYDAAYTKRLADHLYRDLRISRQSHLLTEQQELAALTVAMRAAGVRIDRARLLDSARERKAGRSTLAASLPINPNSPKQILKWAKEIGIALKDTKWETIVKHQSKHPEFDKLLKFRKDSKNLTTWFPLVKDDDGDFTDCEEFTFPRFKVTGTNVDRFACAEPNFQNMPPNLRQYVLPHRDEEVLWSFDYGQIENRTFAYCAGDTGALRLWESCDPYTGTAASMFGVAPEEVTEEYHRLKSLNRKRETYREKGKTTELATIYMETPYNLARRHFGNQKKESVNAAKELQRRYYAARPAIRKFHNRILEEAESGTVAVRNPFGRARVIYAQDPHERAKRACHFYGCSTAARIVNRAAIKIWKSMGLVPMLIVHDELVYSLPSSGSDDTVREIYAEMGKPIEELGGLRIPVSASFGPSYGNQTEVDLCAAKAA